jgi:ABC-type dipeptide/oligopeptide/nickel transport system permease subunit
MNERWILFKRNLTDFWRAFRRNRLGLIGAFLVVSALLVAIFAPALSPYKPTDVVRDENGPWHDLCAAFGAWSVRHR